MPPTNLEILAYEPSPLGMICLRRRELLARPGTVVTEITLDHEFLMSSYSNASERALSLIAREMHPGRDLEVLIGGLGLGYTASAALGSDRVARVEVIEYLPQVIDWLRPGMIPLAEELGADPRFSVTQGDVFQYLASPPERSWDLILIDVDHSPDERLGNTNADFYTEAGLGVAKRHLAPGGVLGVWSYVESSPFSQALRRVFSHVRIESVEFGNELVGEREIDWLFFARD